MPADGGDTEKTAIRTLETLDLKYGADLCYFNAGDKNFGFSASPCHACGDTQHGERHQVIGQIPTRPVDLTAASHYFGQLLPNTTHMRRA
ncbi:hypothetical protein [Saccharopolyspora hattusasensis]|uniref:hypothetical protein n=1 Tax=Saccharopolyspora hattusasensis TaxID=1128679 RepID=UPI003D968206